MTDIKAPMEVLADQRMSKNALRLLAYAIHTNQNNKPFTLRDALYEIKMSYQTNGNARDKRLELGYFKPYDAPTNREVQWKLSDNLAN